MQQRKLNVGSEDCKPSRRKAWDDKYRRSNPDTFRKSQRDYKRRRYKEDPEYRLQMQLRSRLSKAIGRASDVTAAISQCGCTLPELLKRIEAQFPPGMSWEDRSAWHVDHIYPLGAIDGKDRRQVIAACNWRNLRPVWAVENWRKNDKVTPEAEALLSEIMEAIYPEVDSNAAEV